MPNQRFTVFDVLEAKGVFRKNPANRDSQTDTGEPLYAGPQQYPKMVYHPNGEERIVIGARVEMTPYGPKEMGEQRELIYRIVNNPEEEGDAIASGWHLHPAQSIAASGKPAPSTGAEQTIEQLKAQILQLQTRQQQMEATTPKPVNKL